MMHSQATLTEGAHAKSTEGAHAKSTEGAHATSTEGKKAAVAVGWGGATADAWQAAPAQDFDTMMNELDSKLDSPTAATPAATHTTETLYDTHASFNDDQGHQTESLLTELKEAQNRSVNLKSEMASMQTEAELSRESMARSYRVDSSAQRVLEEEREEAKRNEKLAENVQSWLQASQNMMMTNTKRFETLQQTLETAALATVLLLFLLSVYVMQRASVPTPHEIVAPKKQKGEFVQQLPVEAATSAAGIK